MTLVRFVHAAPNAPDLDVRTGETAAFSQVAFKDVTPYREIEENRPDFKAVPANQPAAQPVAEDAELVLDGKYYTVVAVPSDDGRGVELETLRGDGDMDRTKARIRFVHAAPRAGDIDIMATAMQDPLLDDVVFGDDPNYREVAPGATQVVVRAAKGDRVLLQMSELQLASGESVTIVLTHPSASSDRIEAIRITDQARPAADSPPVPRRDTMMPPTRDTNAGRPETRP